jgi:hypothetical protein
MVRRAIAAKGLKMDVINFLKSLMPSRPKRAFYAVVKCSDCGEEARIRIDRSSDFQVEYNGHNPEHCYTIKKEIIGKNCFNLMKISLALTKEAGLLFSDTQGCKLVSFERDARDVA